MVYDADDERPTRTERKRREKAIIDQSRKILEDFIQVPDHKITSLNVDASSHDDLMLLRRLKPSKARLRLLKNLAERLDEDEMNVLTAIIRGESSTGTSGTTPRMLSGVGGPTVVPGEEAMQEIRQACPDADHQHLRQLVLQGRRTPRSSKSRPGQTLQVP